MIEVRDTHAPSETRYRGHAKCATLASAVRTALSLSRVLARPVTVWVDGVQSGGSVDGRPT